MSEARSQFLEGMRGLETAAGRIGSPSLGSNSSRSPEYLQLNGLHVIAFALLEDFLRKRTNEVLTSLGMLAVNFESFPADLKLHILQESFKGIGFYISRKDDESRLDRLLMEVMTLNTSTDSDVIFQPSDFCFGKSQSNISLAQIVSLLQSFGIDVAVLFSKIMEIQLRLSHLGSAEVMFKRLAENRNAAAHAFSLNFDLVKFSSDLKTSYKVFAFLFDTALSQAVFFLAKSHKNKNDFLAPVAEVIPFRSIRFDSIKNDWKVIRYFGAVEEELDSIKEKELNAKLEKIKKGKHDKDDTIYVINFDGSLNTWLQPI